MKSLSFNEFIITLKSAVADMNARAHQVQDDFIWPDVIRCLDYVRLLEVDDFRKIRLHTSLITGEFVYQFWHKFPPYDPELWAHESGYLKLIEGLPEAWQIGEPINPELPISVGVNYRGKILNKNTVRYQSCISNLAHLKVLSRLQDRQSYVMEIGGGYGGLAYHLHQVLPRSTYILVDLPPMLLFSGAYFKLHHPEARIYIYHPDTFAQMRTQGFPDCDLVLLPVYALGEPGAEHWPALDLVINMMSFQEMPAPVIDHYLRFAAIHLNPEDSLLYSNNIDRHPCNHDATVNVSAQLTNYFHLFPEPDQYTVENFRADHPWFYRFYAGSPRQYTPHFAPESRIMARAYTPVNQTSASGFFEPDWKYFNLP